MNLREAVVVRIKIVIGLWWAEILQRSGPPLGAVLGRLWRSLLPLQDESGLSVLGWSPVSVFGVVNLMGCFY